MKNDCNSKTKRRTKRGKRTLKQLEDMGFDHHYSKGENSTIVGIIGDTSTLDTDDLKTH